MDNKAVNVTQDGSKELYLRKPYTSPVLRRMGPIQEVLQANCNLGHDHSDSATS